MHPGQLEALTRAHLDDLRSRPAARVLIIRPEPRLRDARNAVGWFLVCLGLRLALPAQPPAPVTR